MKFEKLGAVSRGTVITMVVLLLITALAVTGAVYLLEKTQDEGESELVIYAYTSFESYGLGPAVIPKFEEKYGVNVTVETPGDVGNVLAKLKLEKNDPQADVVIGVDNSMLHRAVGSGLLEPYTPVNIDRLDPTMSFDPGHYVVPFDYGYIAIICNGTRMEDLGLEIPSSVLDLADPEYRDNILLIDPEQSSTGSSFLIWASTVAGDQGRKSYFQDLAANAGQRVYNSWDSMYAAWENGEAPIAISYGLDTAYEVMWYGTNNTITVVPDDEGYRQIEGAGLVKGAKDQDLARKFLDFILTDDFQSEVYNNYMLPVVPEIEIDPVFLEHGAFAEDHVEPDIPEVEENYDVWLEDWRQAFY